MQIIYNSNLSTLWLLENMNIILGTRVISNYETDFLKKNLLNNTPNVIPKTMAPNKWI